MSEAVTAPIGLRVRIGRFLFTYRNAIFPATVAVMVLVSRPQLYKNDPRADLFVSAAGFGVALLGQALRAVVIGFSYIQRGGKNRKIDAPTLVRDGIFSLSRNPLYVGNILIIVGLVVIYNSLWIYVTVLPAFFFAYICIVAAEEEFLRGKFGEEYDLYCLEVNRFIPMPGKWRWVFHGATFDLKRVITKDYTSAFYWVTLALALIMWKGIWNRGFDAMRGQFSILVTVWLAALAAWGAARYVKKKHIWAPS